MGRPPTLEATARDSIGAATFVAQSLPRDSGAQVARIANDAFMGGMSAAMAIAAVVVAVASTALFAFLPARAAAHEPRPGTYAGTEPCGSGM